jgi:hypothetical protein
MRRRFQSFAVLGAAIAAFGLTWSVPALAITSFSITPNAVSGSPGSTIEFVLSVNDADDFANWAGVVVNLDSVTGFQDPPLPEAPEFPFVKVDAAPGSVVARSLIGKKGDFFVALGQPLGSGGCDSGEVGCVTVSDFAGLTAKTGELLSFKLDIGVGTPVSNDPVVVSYSVSYFLKDPTGIPVPGFDKDGVRLPLPEFNVMVVPEPSTYGLFGAGLVMVLFAGHRRFQRAAPKVS